MSEEAAVSDAEVMAASRLDSERFGEIFDRHAAAVHGFLARRGGRDRADDLLGEVFTIAFDRRRSFDTRYPSALPWLVGIAHNLLRTRLRKDSMRPVLLSRIGTHGADNPWEDVDGRLDAVEPGSRAARALAHLPVGERDVVQLVAWEGLSVSEAAAVLRIPAGTARSRLHRARTALRAAIGIPQTGETS